MQPCDGAACLAQALGNNVAAVLWRRALRDTGVSAAGDELALALATAIGDLLVYRGDDAVGRAALRVGTDERLPAWLIAMWQPTRQPRATAAAYYLVGRCLTSACSCLGVRVAAHRACARAATAAAGE